jgi:hypothetical protein
MLRADLKVSDIPSRTTIRKRALEMLQEHFDMLEEDMKVWYWLFLLLRT